MSRESQERDIWYWYHNISECYYHIQLTIKYRRALFNEKVKAVVLEVMKGLKEMYAIEISEVGFDQNHVHIICQFLPKYSGGQVIGNIKSNTGRELFKKLPELKNELYGGEF